MNMTRLDFRFNPDFSAETADYRGFTIRVEPDLDPLNPFQEFDWNPPVLVHADGRLSSYGLDAELPDLSESDIRTHASQIAETLGGSTLLRALGADGRYGFDNAVDAVNGALAELLVGAYDSSKIELIDAVWQWAGAQTYRGTRNGYVQRDWATVLVVATPAWVERVGASPDYNLGATADLWASYAYGDVYGYCVQHSDGETIDSCWGFYGREHSESGLAHYAIDAVDCEIASRRRARFEQLKTWIRHRVPLGVRAERFA